MMILMMTMAVFFVGQSGTVSTSSGGGLLPFDPFHLFRIALTATAAVVLLLLLLLLLFSSRLALSPLRGGGGAPPPPTV